MKIERLKELYAQSPLNILMTMMEGGPESIHWEQVHQILTTQLAEQQIEAAKKQNELTAGLKLAADQQVKLTKALKWATIVYAALTAIQAALIAISVFYRARP